MLHKEFMGGKLVIDIWRDRDEYLGEIHYRTASGIWDYYFNIPQDINNIAWALQSHLDTEVAKIIYEEITDRYNDTLVEIQRREPLTSGADVGHNTVQEILFPPFVSSAAGTTTTICNIGGPTTAIWNIGATPIITDGYYDRLSLVPDTSDYISGNHLSVLSMEEYDIARENGSLHDQVYLVYNNN